MHVALVNAGAQTFAHLRPGGIGLLLLGDHLDMGQQLTSKAGGPLLIVSGDVIADLLVVRYGLGGELTAHQRERPAQPIAGSELAAQRIPPARACRGRC